MDENNVLRISGERKHKREEHGEDGKWHRVERSYGSFTRAFQLPQDSDTSKITANTDNGVLTIGVGKLENPPPKTREIEVA